MRAAWLLLMLAGLETGGTAARADEPASSEEEPEAKNEKQPKHELTVAFSGGALVPQGSMGAQTNTGLDVWGRVGWLTPSGIGLVMNVEYAPLRRAPEGGSTDEVVDSHLFAATAGPRFTIGREMLRAWLAGGAGVVVERTATSSPAASSKVEVDSVLGVSGGGGLDICFFGSGGVTVAGAYTKGLSSGAEQQYVSVNAGLVFVY